MSRSTVILLACAVVFVQGHGRLSEPPNRASLWRDKYDSPPNYDDDGMNCGGISRQWTVNGGKCGICGDAYDLARPRPHELGGKYGLGYIVENYEVGQIIPVSVYISVSHLGYWELRICPDPTYQEQECFDEGYLLELEDGGTKYYPISSGIYKLKYRLPKDLTCEHCVLQWKYSCGNNWGDCKNGTQGLGCGSQENFFSCADIAIRGSVSNDIDDNTIKDPQDLSPLMDALTHDLTNLNDIELELLLRRIELLGYHIVTDRMPSTRYSTPPSPPKNKRKKTNKRKAKKIKTKRHNKFIIWR